MFLISLPNIFVQFVFCPILGDECHCSDWHGCVMAETIVGRENVQPYKFSECSLTEYVEKLRKGRGICLFNRPNQVKFSSDSY